MTLKNSWEDDHGLYRTFTGRTSCAEIMHANTGLHSNPRFDEIKYIINDFTGVSEFEVSAVDIKESIAIDKAASKSKRKLKVAMVATEESLLSYAHLYALKMEETSFECKIFTNRHDACLWIS